MSHDNAFDRGNHGRRTTPAFGTTAHFNSDEHKGFTPGTKMLTLTWETIEQAVDSLTYQFSKLKPSLIIAISRGGLIPATMLSHQLDREMVVISARSYEGTRRTLQKPTEIVGWDPAWSMGNFLIVDDILDTGKTLEAVRQLNPHREVPCATIVNKRSHSHPTAHFITVDPSIWVKFPWEA